LDKTIKIKRVSELPAGDNFPVHVLARYWHVDRKHIINLIESGEIRCAIDLRSPHASRSTIRVPRWAVEEFLRSREIIVVSKTV